MSTRPNILFLMSDEHRADVAGWEGNEVVRTPALDKIASTGVVFTNAYTPSPVCVPGRQCMMAGQLPKTCGSEGWVDLPPGHMTFSRRFAQYNYSTVAAGKLHHQGTDMMQGWTHRIGAEMVMSPASVEGRVEESDNRQTRPFADFKWSDAKEIKRAGVGRGPYLAQDEYAVQGTINYLQETFSSPYYDREQVDRPLLLKVSLWQPHYPYFTDQELFTYYLNRVEPYFDQQPSDHPFLSQRQVRPGVDASHREIRRAVAAYYGMIETIDAHYRRVMDTLEYVGQNPDDWIIVYTSDHGEMLGEHGIWEKQKFYEASARVPLIIRLPGGLHGGRVVSENVNLCDLFATLCDLAEIPAPSGLDSRSLVPLMEGKGGKSWTNETISQFGKTNVMIKRDHLKYQYYGEDMPKVLFDLKSDPGELINVIDAPQYWAAVAGFKNRLSELGHGPMAYSNYMNAGY